MKIRTGFVSNSSSSSFCLLGVSFDSLLKMNPDLELEDVGYDYFEKVLKETKLTYVSGIEAYIEDWVIGVDPNTLNGDVMIGEAKDEIQQQIAKVFGVEKVPEVKFHIDGGRL